MSGCPATIRRHGAHLRRGLGTRVRRTLRSGRGARPGRRDRSTRPSRLTDWEPLEGVDDGIEHDRLRRRRPTDRRPAHPGRSRSRGPIAGALRDVRRRRHALGPPRPSLRGHRRARRAVGGAGRRPRGASCRPSTLDPPYDTTTSRVRRSRPPHDRSCTRRCAAPRARPPPRSPPTRFVIADGPLNEPPAPPDGRLRQEPPRDVPAARAQRGGRRSSRPDSARRCSRSPTTKRYSWYVRLAMLHGGHSWTGHRALRGVRPAPEGRRADDRRSHRRACCRSSRSEPHIDPRAPQNLVPIGALERELRHRMGDPRLGRTARSATPSCEREAS